MPGFSTINKKKLWNVEVKVLLIVLGSLGTLPFHLKAWMRKMTPSMNVETFQNRFYWEEQQSWGPLQQTLEFLVVTFI